VYDEVFRVGRETICYVPTDVHEKLDTRGCFDDETARPLESTRPHEHHLS